jgi:hypothetical protein
MDFEFVAVLRVERRPAEALRNDRGLVPRRQRLLVRHLEEQQIRELLDVVPIRQPVVAEDVAVVPELLDDL